jgi:uncharacterized protein DUF4386
MRQMSTSNTHPYRAKKGERMNTTKENPHGTNRKTAIIVGVLFIVGTVAGVLSVVFTGSTLTDPNYLIKVAEYQSEIVTAALLVFTMAVALAMVPVVIYPVLRKHNETLALGYVVFRGALETMAAIATAIMWLLLLVLSREYVAAGTPDASSFQALGAVILKGTDPIGALAGIVFDLGALMLYYVFYQSKLIPRWLSVWGFIAIGLNLATGLLILFGLQTAFDTSNSIMNFPIFLQEMVMAVWLIVKGFNPAAIGSLPAKTATKGFLSAA